MGCYVEATRHGRGADVLGYEVFQSKHLQIELPDFDIDVPIAGL
ncbi:MAG: hypothetical protein M5U01_10895 [Ardenticatenaceae bacterium]|nr:hypothetical protein [Ardenticatenaceae bacterium]